MAVQLVGVAFVGEPEAALAVRRQAFAVELLRGSTVARDAQGVNDLRGLRGCVDREDRRLRLR